MNPRVALLPLFALSLTAAAQTNFTTENLTLETRTATLPATLLIPAKLLANAPVALIIAGSGPTDRDGNSGQGLQTNTYKLIAEGLANAGIASLRYDKFASGSSKLKITNEAELTFEDGANDAAAWIETLKKDSRFKSFYVIGHSEGSLVGILAAQKSSVDGFISLAGPGRNIADVLLEQLKPQFPADLFAETTRVITELRAGRKVAASGIKLPAQLRDSLFRDSVQPYLISWMRSDPAEEIKKLKAKVLIVQGNTDIQVKVADAERLGAAAGVKPVILGGVNHPFKNAPLEQSANLATYNQPNLPLGTGVLETLLNFLKP